MLKEVAGVDLRLKFLGREEVVLASVHLAGRARRVVADTATCSVGKYLMTPRINVPLPAPEGPDTTNTLRRVLACARVGPLAQRASLQAR